MRLSPGTLKLHLACALAVALQWGAVAPARSASYEPFTDGEHFQAEDELEERIWDEANTLKAQFVRGRPSADVAAMQSVLNRVLAHHWPSFARALRVHLVDSSDVLAVSSANGDILLSTGMLARLDDEEELSVVLAREVSHITRRHSARTVYYARVSAGASVLFQTAMQANSLIGSAAALSSLTSVLQVNPQMLLADGGKAFLQSQLNKTKDKLADNFARSLSATGIDAVVKTSLFGFSESIEREADDDALRLLQEQYGRTTAYDRVMRRLLAEAQADERKFAAFYANEERLKARVQVADNQASAPAPLSNSAPAAAVTASPDPRYASLRLPLLRKVYEAELDAGHLGRVLLNMGRDHAGTPLPAQLPLLQARACIELGDAQRLAQGDALLSHYLGDHPDDPQALKLAGLAALRQGHPQQARDYLAKARQRVTDDDERIFIDQYLRQVDKKLSTT